MAKTFLKWVIPGAVTVIGGTVLALSFTTAPIAKDLELRSAGSLKDAGIEWASLRIDGRDAILTGTATTQRMIDDATATVASVTGVRAVGSNVVLAEFVSPFPFAASLSDGKITLSGGYPSEAAHAAILADTGDVIDSTRLLSGGPDSATFESAAKFAIGALKQFDQGDIALADLSLTISGRAKSSERFAALQSLRDNVPASIELAALTITPPLVTPYTWSATYDGSTLVLGGTIPDAGLEAQLRALAPVGVHVTTSLTLGSGEPEGFADNALTLLKSLLLLESGRASITDADKSLSGAPASPAIVAEVTETLAKIGAVGTLDPPRIDDFSLTIDKSAAALTFSGFVPDAATRDRLAQLARADVKAVELGRGAPERFPSGLDFGLDLLGYFSEGRFELNGTSLNLSGRTASLSDYRAVRTKAEEGAPQGFALARVDIRPPIANPFRFKAVKDAAGAVTLSGFLPEDGARADLATHIANLAADNADPADGAPENFTSRAGKGLDVLALLDSGSLSFDGTDWLIEGLVDTPQKGFAADAAFSAAGLRTLGFRYDVRQPPLPIISPYTWRAQKTADGAVSFAGFAPHDTFRASLKALAPNALDSSALGAGAPTDFEASATAGLEALLALEEGSLGLNGNLWTLTGQVADTATRDQVQTALSARIDPGNWRITVQARDTAPVITPYLWSATKAADGTIDLAGYTPDEALKASVAAKVGKLGRDTVAVASGEPAGFAEDIAAGLDALSHLTGGKAAFDGSRWTLTGTVASQDQGEAALAALLGGSRQGASWTSAISGYIAPLAPQPSSSSEPSSSAVSSSEAPASSEPMSSEPSSEPLSSEPPSPQASSEPVSAEPSSSEPASGVSSLEPSSEPVAAEEPAEDRSLIVVDPLPARFTFEASKESGQPIALKGVVLREATIPYFAELAGDVPADNMIVSEGLPVDFVANGATGIEALLVANEGRLGFDGTRWWLRGMVETPEARDTITNAIATLPGGKDWSVFIGVLTPIEICRDHVAALERLNAITFQSGSATLTETSLPIIDTLAADLNTCADASVHVEGHTDADGAEDLNLALSVARAETVVEALIERNVDLERLYAEGYGESQPIADNETKEGKARNRRIAFSITAE